MKAWKTILAGWLTFVLGHAMVVAVRARMLTATFDSGHPAPISETTFRIIDGIILCTAFLLIAMGTFTMLNKANWKLAIALLVLTVQIGIAFIVYLIVTFAVHMGVGGAL
ncbi:MAG: hypothetical protein GX811_10325 [Lentisphaerae bacterium]|nr:hypothetical protein [Lentisphaerota bacterium]